MREPKVDLIDQSIWERGVPYGAFAELRRTDPVHWHEEPDGPGFWALTLHADIRAVSNDPARFSSYAAGVSRLDVEDEGQLAAYRSIVIAQDPPDHRRSRGLVSTIFTPRAVSELEAPIRALAREAVARALEKREIDFVAEYASPVPMHTISEMMGVPEEHRLRLLELSGGLVDDQDPEVAGTSEFRTKAQIEVFMIAQQLAERERKTPGDNLTQRLLTAEVDGWKLSEAEFNTFFMFLIIAGNETTRTAMSGGLTTLLEHPEQLAMLRENPSLLPSAIEEMLRFWPPIHHFRRTAMCDVEMRGKTIRKGDKVVMWYPSGNRDESVFEDPDRFDIRRDPNDHLSFGFGEHFCLGASLARLEMRVMFEELLGGVAEITPLAPPRRLRSNLINGIKEMRVELRPV
ncbi:MAG: cytochrome P450 [Deltaproteobacteria bacterium]